MRGATELLRFTVLLQNISIHAPHAGRDLEQEFHGALTVAISIHAPHAGRDDTIINSILDTFIISIHAPHAGRDI